MGLFNNVGPDVYKHGRRGRARVVRGVMEGATYIRIGHVDEKATIFVLRVTFAFLAAASLFALVATLTYVHASNTAATYVAALSTIINAVAAWHYNEIVKIRVGQTISIESEWAIDALRCVVTTQTQTYNPRRISAALEQARKSMQNLLAGTATGP